MVLDQVAYEHEARGVRSLKILTLSRCNEGTNENEPVKNPYRAVCNVFNRNYQPIEISVNSRLNLARNKGGNRLNSV